MREGQNSCVGVVCIGDMLEAKAGKFGRDFRRAHRDVGKLRFAFAASMTNPTEIGADKWKGGLPRPDRRLRFSQSRPQTLLLPQRQPCCRNPGVLAYVLIRRQEDSSSSVGSGGSAGKVITVVAAGRA